MYCCSNNIHIYIYITSFSIGCLDELSDGEEDDDGRI